MPATSALAETVDCTQATALKAVRRDASIAVFCDSPVNGMRYGCDYEIRPPSALNTDEMKDHELKWIIIGSVIHSFDEKGHPRFMPDGAVVAKMSKACEIISVTGPFGRSLKH